MWHGSSRVVLLAMKIWGSLSPGRIFGFLLATWMTVVATASAADLVGRVTNGTTKKPAAGDEVVLLTLAGEGMNERTNTDRAGHFSLSVTDTQASHLVRVIHQGVTYHKLIKPGLNPVAIEVYDVAEKLDGVTAIMDVQRFEATGDRLEVKQLITMRNASSPPRTLMSDRPFEIQLPPEAQVLSGLVQLGEGKPVKSKPVPGERKDEYYFRFPLRPGDTRFAVVYRLPYNGEAVIEPRIRNAQERFVVMLPKSMTFEPQAGGIFRAMPDVSPDNVQGTGPAKLGQTLAFRVSGMGTLAELQGRREERRSEELQRTAKLDQHSIQTTLPRPCRVDAAVLSGLAMALLIFGVAYVVKIRQAMAVAATEHDLLTYERRRHRDQRDDWRKHHERVKPQNARTGGR
jgi:hypothetical protein